MAIKKYTVTQTISYDVVVCYDEEEFSNEDDIADYCFDKIYTKIKSPTELNDKDMYVAGGVVEYGNIDWVEEI